MKKMKRLIALLLTLVMLLPTLNVSAANGSEDLTFNTLGKKTAEALVKPGDYEITLSVPGALKTEKYSEIIVMVDASSSQGGNLNTLKANLVDIAEQVLHNDGSVRLTLMGFGMGPALVGSFYNAETLESYLKNVTQADLRQGVSATNCEGAFEFIRKYVESSDKLNKTCVIFTSDGSSNMDETEFKLLDWELHQADWMQKGVTPVDIYKATAGIQADMLASGGAMLDATTRVFPEEALAVEIAKVGKGVGSDEYLTAVDNLYKAMTASDEIGIAYVDAVITNAVTAAGLDPAKAYSTSDYEKVFLNFADANFLYDLYFACIFGVTQDKNYPDHYWKETWGKRAAEEADKLCANDKVLDLFMLDFSNRPNMWMNPAASKTYKVTSDKITYLASNSYSTAVGKMQDLADEMFTTLYENTTVVDPMSKWVKLKEDSIRLFRDDEVIWSIKDGWKIDESERPVSGSPVKIDTDGNGHRRITWLIKEGPLLYTDRYFLKYHVDVDETVEGFVYDKEYPANDPTHVEYTDENGTEQKRDVPVPDVKQPKEPDDFKEDDYGIQIYKGTPESKPISDITFSVYKVVPGEGDVLEATPSAADVEKYATSENLVANITTNANGYAALNLTEKGLGKGIYLITEHKNDKVVEPVDPFYVMLPMMDADSGETLKVISIYPKNVPVTPGEDPIPPVIPEDPGNEEYGKITILKHQEGDESVVLKGAQFKVYRLATPEEIEAEEAKGEDSELLTTTYNETECALLPATDAEGKEVVLESDKDGLATTGDMEYGLYFLVETKAPIGYNVLEKPLAAWVTTESEDIAVNVPNQTIFLLPETGGIGTGIFTVAGSIIMCLALAMILFRKRTEENC